MRLHHELQTVSIAIFVFEIANSQEDEERRRRRKRKKSNLKREEILQRFRLRKVADYRMRKRKLSRKMMKISELEEDEGYC